mmetsp:Transcript_65533/g.103779  ORF Transcript_65533/g.103779 Transcript_65533/m.103779 type:complete len:231 (+) Transcript_65533:185-877(+)
MMRSATVNDSGRCATLITVDFASLNCGPRNTVLKVCSVVASTWEVASSRTSIGQLRNKALAKDNSCCWPLLRLLPAMPTSLSKPFPRVRNVSCSPTAANTFQSFSSKTSVHSRTKFDRIVPEKMTGCCGIIASRFRTNATGTVAKSTPSIEMVPLATWAIPKIAANKDDFPLPDRPTIPMHSPESTWKLTPRRTHWCSWSLMEYDTYKSENNMAPFVGQQCPTLVAAALS